MSVLFVLAICALIYIYVKDAPPVFFYIAYFVLGATISYELIFIVALKDEKRTLYLEQKMKLWNNISFRVKGAGETSFNEMPVGIIVFDDNFNIEWSNYFAKKIFKATSLNNKSLDALDTDFAQKVRKRVKEFTVKIYDQVIAVDHRLAEHILYLTDITASESLKQQYLNRTLAMGVLNLDNLDGAFASLDAQERSLHMARIIGIIMEWAKEQNICVKGYSDERYLLIMNHRIVEEQEKNGFYILDKIQEYGEKEEVRITTSIGIACQDINPVQLLEEASEQLDLALNRGGNQAVVKIDDKITYYGARSSSHEERSAVFIRGKVEELLNIINQHDEVFIMGHKESDADSFGACIAMAKIVQAENKIAKIVINPDLLDETTANIYRKIETDYISMKDLFISAQDAAAKMNEKILLIILDCQYQYLLMSEKVYKKAKDIAIIDHHSRNPDAIYNYKFLYTETRASSTVELVVEMYEFFDNQIEVTPIEATWMLMGIFIDTNNFVYRTTERTFNVLALLYTYGADMNKAQRFLRENFAEYVKRISVLNNIEVLDGGYCIAVCDDDIYDRTFIAKIADNMILLNNVKAAFCIGKIGENQVGISGRSLDEANVQVIMEKMGGGGHFNNSATQLRNTTISEAKANLIEILKAENKEESFMKVILVKDVKGKGKAKEVLEVPAGYGNFLIRSKQAILGNPENIKELESSKIREQQEEEKRLRDMQKLKEKIESLTVKVGVKVGTSGKLFGSVTHKDIVVAFHQQNNILLDRKKIQFNDTIDRLGTYKIPIELHKEVKAIITLYVVEASV